MTKEAKYIYKDKILFVRQDLSGKYRIFQKAMDKPGWSCGHVCRIKAFGAYGIFCEAQRSLNIEAQRRGLKLWEGDE